MAVQADMPCSEIDKMQTTLEKTAGILKKAINSESLLSNDIDEAASKRKNVETKHQSHISKMEMEVATLKQQYKKLSSALVNSKNALLAKKKFLQNSENNRSLTQEYNRFLKTYCSSSRHG